MAEENKDSKKIYEIVEKAAKTGKVDRGVNEATKAAERGVAKLIVIASDVDPKELTQHFEPLCKEKGIKLEIVESKEKLGITAGIGVKCSAIAVIEPGEAKLDGLK